MVKLEFYKKEDYPKFQQIRDDLPSTYEAWLHIFEKTKIHLTSEGREFEVVRAEIPKGAQTLAQGFREVIER